MMATFASSFTKSLFKSQHFIKNNKHLYPPPWQQCQTRIKNVVDSSHRSTKRISYSSFQLPILLPLRIGRSCSLPFHSCFAVSFSAIHLLHRFRSSPLSSPMSSLNSNTNPDAKTVRAVIKGRVQGVFYRDWTVENAKELGLKGWVRNRRDGSVEALFSGSPEKVQEMEQRCRRGPPSAIVTGLDVFPCDDDPGTGFERKQTA